MTATPITRRIDGSGHWLVLALLTPRDERLGGMRHGPITGCVCGFEADESDCGYGDSVIDHIEAVVRSEMDATRPANV